MRTRVRRIEGELERDHGARGVAHDVRALDAELAHEQRAVGRVVGHAERPFDAVAAREPGSVVAQQAIVIGEGGASMSGSPQAAHTPQWIRTTGSPDPRSSYSSSRPSTAARSIRCKRLVLIKIAPERL